MGNVTCPVIKCGDGDNGICLSTIERDDDIEDDSHYIMGKFECVLKFIVKDVSDNLENAQYEEGYEDDYTLNEINIYHFDYLHFGQSKNNKTMTTDLFKEKWKEIGKEFEERKKGNLNFKSLQPAIDAIIKCVGLNAVERTDRLDDDEQTTQHALYLFAFTDKNEPIFMRAAFM